LRVGSLLFFGSVMFLDLTALGPLPPARACMPFNNLNHVKELQLNGNRLHHDFLPPLNWSPKYFKLPEQNFRSRSFQPHFPFDAVRSSDSFVTPTLESGLTCATHTHTLAWTCKKQGSYGSYSGPSLTIVTQLGKTKRVRKHQLFCCSLYYLKFIIILH